MSDPFWIWQQANWPHFSWQAEPLAPLLRACTHIQGRLLGMLGAVGSDTEAQSSLDALLQNIVTSSSIEGEHLDVGSVHSSLARRLGINEEGRTTARA
jgi:Fic family protein